MPADDRPLRISQYTYFALKSETMPASAMTEYIGIQPDSALVRGSKRTVPALPVCHVWRIECGLPGVPVDQQVARVLDRIRPVADKVRALTASASVSAVLQIVRDFANDEGESESIDVVVSRAGVVLEKLAGQHQLLGWHLAAEDLALLASLSADLDVDEYGR